MRSGMQAVQRPGQCFTCVYLSVKMMVMYRHAFPREGADPGGAIAVAKASTKTRVLTTQDHRRKLDENRYVYAVLSRRSGGVSIGVNLNPDKVCNFDCIYCQVDRTTPGRTPGWTWASWSGNFGTSWPWPDPASSLRVPPLPTSRSRSGR